MRVGGGKGRRKEEKEGGREARREEGQVNCHNY